MFQTVPLSIIRSFSLFTHTHAHTHTRTNGMCHTGLLTSCQQTCTTYTTAVHTVKKS